MSLVPLSPVCLALCPLYLCPYLSLSDALGVLVAGDGILVGERERAFGRLDVQCLLAFVWTSRPPINLNLLSSLSPPATSLLSSLYSHNPFPSYARSIFRIDYTTTPLASPPYTRPAPSSSASSSCIRPRPGRFRGLATGEHARKDYPRREKRPARDAESHLASSSLALSLAANDYSEHPYRCARIPTLPCQILLHFLRRKSISRGPRLICQSDPPSACRRP